MRSTKIIKICSSGLCTCFNHIVILRTRNKITDFFMILAWASPFTGHEEADAKSIVKHFKRFGVFFVCRPKVDAPHH